MAYLWAALGIATLHGLSPGHWLPYVVAARANGWHTARLVAMTVGGTLLHLTATFLLTALALLLSYGLSHLAGHALQWLGGGLLILLGLAYCFRPEQLAAWSARGSWLLLVGIGIQPCAEVIPLLIAAALAGPAPLLLAAGTFAVTTLLLVPVLVIVASLGLAPLLIERHTRLLNGLTGGVLLLAGLLSLQHTH